MKTIPHNGVYRISIPGNKYDLMRKDVELLYRHECFTSCSALVMCYIDALASSGLKSDRGRFGRFVKANFAELYRDLNRLVRGKSGGDILYDRYRNGLLHGLGPKKGFALCRNDELDGACAGEVEVEGIGRFTGINVDRLVASARRSSRGKKRSFPSRGKSATACIAAAEPSSRVTFASPAVKST